MRLKMTLASNSVKARVFDAEMSKRASMLERFKT
jgi:hypothetical protein